MNQLRFPFRLVIAGLACMWPIVLVARMLLADEGGQAQVQGQWSDGVLYAASLGLPVSLSALTIASVLLLAALNSRKRFANS